MEIANAIKSMTRYYSFPCPPQRSPQKCRIEKANKPQKARLRGIGSFIKKKKPYLLLTDYRQKVSVSVAIN